MLWKKSLAVLGVAGAVALFSAGTASAQASNDALVKRGKTLWQNRGCAGCHAIGKKNAGPDLAGVTARRSKDWLVRWLKDTEGMLASDSTAMTMLEEWKGMRMPGQKLSDQEIDALLAFIDAETARKRG
jgi:mono/diheme cytochrome c family protein